LDVDIGGAPREGGERSKHKNANAPKNEAFPATRDVAVGPSE